MLPAQRVAGALLEPKLMLSSITNEEIVTYYDQCQQDYQIVWHLNTCMSMHYGYWDETTPNLRTALQNMNTRIAGIAAIGPNDRVLDAGCGVGGSSIYLSQSYGCQVEAITLSAQQVNFAEKKASELGVSGVHFSVGNYLHTNFPDNHFDVVWALESVCHAREKEQFIREAFRILKKKGRLIVADFFSNNPPQHKQDVLQKWARTWAVPAFEYHETFKLKCRQNNFSGVESFNITRQILPSAKRLYYCFVPGLIFDGLLRLAGKRTKANKANVWSTLYQYQGLKADLWSYHIIRAVK